jgi:geranyl-CoA carboxylase beta subunit
MRIVTEEPLKRKGKTPHPAALRRQYDQIVAIFERPQDAFTTSGLLLDARVLDPRDTRAVLGFCLDTVAEAGQRRLRPMQFSVARM